MKLKHLYENYELKKSDDVKKHNVVNKIFENDDCQIIDFSKNKNPIAAEYPTSNVQALQLLVDDINNTSNQINKHEKLVELLNSSLVNNSCEKIAKLLSTNYFGYSGWHIPSFETLKKLKTASSFAINICLDKIVLNGGRICLTNFGDGGTQGLATDFRLILIRYK